MSRIECKTCDESGAIRDMDGELIDCPECNGLGWTEVDDEVDVTGTQRNDIKTMPNCGTCKYWEYSHDHHEGCHPDDRIGTCKRYPPVFDVIAASELHERNPHTYNDRGVGWVQPTVYAHDWCGEYFSS